LIDTIFDELKAIKPFTDMFDKHSVDIPDDILDARDAIEKWPEVL